jgi:transcriptional regulator with XRE-family HTH domain
MWPDGFPSGDYVRQARCGRGLSQRAFAEEVGVSRSLLDRVEAGRTSPRVEDLELALAADGLFLVVVREVEGEGLVFVPPLEELDGPGMCRDGAGRRYPAHLGLVVDPVRGEWWGDRFGMTRPPETFHRDQVLREVRRSLSQEEVRPGRPAPLPRWPFPLVRAAYALQKEGNREGDRQRRAYLEERRRETG